MSHSPHDVIAAVTASEDGETVFTISRGQLLRSDDGGLSWQRMMKGMYCLEITCGTFDALYLTASPSYKIDTTVYFGSRKYGLRRSTDGGFNWLPVGQDLFQHCLGKGHTFHSHPNSVERIILCSQWEKMSQTKARSTFIDPMM
jgi:hypothetical protein